MLHIVACLYLSSQLYYMGRVKKLIGGWSNHRATHCSVFYLSSQLYYMGRVKKLIGGWSNHRATHSSVFISQLSAVLHGESEETDR